MAGIWHLRVALFSSYMGQMVVLLRRALAPLPCANSPRNSRNSSAQSSTALGKTSHPAPKQPKERHHDAHRHPSRLAANNGTDVEITVSVSDPANARITGTLVECEEDFVKLVNVRPYAALDRYVAIQHIVWVNRQPR